jgi:hypothetical protein
MYGPPKKSHPVRNVLLTVLGIIMVLVVVGVVLGVVLDDGSQKDLDAYMAGQGVKYSFPKDTAKVRLVAEPKYGSQSIDTAIGPIEMETAILERRSYEMLFMRVPIPMQGNVRGGLVGGIEGGAQSAGIKIGAIQDVKVNGKPAVWAHGTWKGDEADMTAVYANGYMYLLAVHTKDNSTDVQREFERSFKSP